MDKPEDKHIIKEHYSFKKFRCNYANENDVFSFTFHRIFFFFLLLHKFNKLRYYCLRAILMFYFSGKENLKVDPLVNTDNSKFEFFLLLFTSL